MLCVYICTRNGGIALNVHAAVYLGGFPGHAYVYHMSVRLFVRRYNTEENTALEATVNHEWWRWYGDPGQRTGGLQ